ncbi:MAG: exodeoxyribonuclease V subunit alpha, partial [Betaproteobacteria bacterium]|nr:exodeoxyribonuclease V subunit alpha [Betaproteobacteria bacterium]
MSLPLFGDACRRRVLDALRAWAQQGWLRRVDHAFAEFIAQACPDDDAQVLLATALLAHLEGLGHACLDLGEDTPPVDLGAQPELSQRLLALAAELLPAGARTRGGAWTEALRASAAVWCPEQGCGTDAGQPLVLEHGRLYLRRYREYEQRLATQWLARAGATLDSDDALAAEWMGRLFDGDAQADAEADWQRIACALALRHRVSVITGGPGTGKTFTAARLLVLLLATASRPEALRVALAAPTGKAAARLKESIDDALGRLAARLGADTPALRLAARIEPARTLHSLLGARGDTRSLRHHRGRPLDVDVLLVDEASMVHLEMMADLVDALPEHARLVLLGDRDQLASVEAGAVLGELCAHAHEGRYTPDTVDAVRRLSGQPIAPALRDPHGPLLAQSVAMLRRSRRFGGGIARLARAVNAGDPAEARSALGAHEELQWIPRAEPSQVCELALREPALRACLRLALDACADEASARDERALRVLRGLDDFRVLCAVRRGPWGVEQVNAALERALRSGGLLGEGAPWYEGRVVMVTRNDPDLGLFNGDVGVALRAAGGALRVAFARADGVRWIGPGRLAHVETAFA